MYTELLKKAIDEGALNKRKQVSRAWLAQNVKRIFKDAVKEIKEETKGGSISDIRLRNLYLFGYNNTPQLVMILNTVPNGFMGIDLLELGLVERAVFLDAIAKALVSDTVSRVKLGGPLKRFLIKSVTHAPTSPINIDEWEHTLFLPSKSIKF